MPFHLKESDVLPQTAGLESVLIVPCRFCPAASLAVTEKKLYIEFFRRFLRTGAYEAFIQDLRRRIEATGTRTAVFDSKLPHHFVTCMWMTNRRKELAARAAQFDGAVVLGCDAAVETVRQAVKSTDCRVIPGMEVDGGIMNVLPTVSFPLNISLELQSVTPISARSRR